MSGVPSFQLCALLFFVYRSEGRKEGCVSPFESELATVGRRRLLLSAVSIVSYSWKEAPPSFGCEH